jgi:1,4-alpha-glucan branching enzyme
MADEEASVVPASTTAGEPVPAPDVLRIPAPGAAVVELRFASLADRDRFDPGGWRRARLGPEGRGWFSADLSGLGLPDGAYEYELILDGRADDPIPDPWAEEITRFDGYRGVFHIRDGRRWRPPFRWDDELPSSGRLPGNEQLVIYELPIRWIEHGPEAAREVGLGNFDHLIFEHLDVLADLGITAIELLPAQDSPDTLSWGYGTRFFMSPDYDLGTPVDMKLFVKRCHQRGIRVLLDVVMNHARRCPLERLAKDWYFCEPGDEAGRDTQTWGGTLFRFQQQVPAGVYHAREFLYQMAEYWVREYRIDGFRIDEFKGIGSWDFLQEFRDRATRAHERAFPGRPFIVIAEDSWRRTQATRRDPGNPHGRPVVDAMWNFAFHDEARRLLTNQLHTQWGRASRRERIRALVENHQIWDELRQEMSAGFDDLRQAINYICSHDVEQEGAQRYMNYILAALVWLRQLGGNSPEAIRAVVDGIERQSPALQQAHAEALDRSGSAFALLMTAVGIPMFLAGEEIGDVHDLQHTNWRLKMTDPIDFERVHLPGHAALRARVRELIRLRVSHSALQAGDVEFVHFHPTIDDNDGLRVFAYGRTDGRAVGQEGQVLVVVNAGAETFEEYAIPCPWAHLQEVGAPPGARPPELRDGRVALSLAPFQVRVFAT